MLDPLDLVGIGRAQFRLSGETLEEIRGRWRSRSRRSGHATTGAGACSPTTSASSSSRARCSPSSARREPASRPSERALRAARRAAGTVLYNGVDLYAHYDELRQRIGLVPQDDILHAQLRVRGALTYAAELRFPPDHRGPNDAPASTRWCANSAWKSGATCR